MRTPASVPVCCVLLVFAVNGPLRADTIVDDFERPTAPAPWTFYNGAEFPGATGSLSAGIGRGGTGTCAHLAFDMSGGGNYVSANLHLASPVRAQGALAFWVRSPAGVNVTLRLVDSTGQTLQYNLNRPIYAVDTAAWYRLAVRFTSAPGGYWGGADDGVVHGALTGLAVLAEPYKYTDTSGHTAYLAVTGAIDFDDVTRVDSTAEYLGPLVQATALPSAGDLGPKLGANIHFTQDTRALDALQAAGFTWVRMDLAWSGIERTKGTYDFSAFDGLVSALAARGMKAHFILDYGNSLYTDSAGSMVPPRTPAAIAGFAAYARAAAAHFGDSADQYEVWNEPNIVGFWSTGPSASEYANLSKAAIPAVHQGNANARVSTAGLAGMDMGFLQGLIAAGGAAGADAIGVHPYRQGSPETVAGDLLIARAFVQRGIPTNTPPIWETEWGYSSTWYGIGTSSSARDHQAKLVVRELLTSWVLGFPFAVYYDVRDDGTDSSNAEHNFGLLANDYSDKPSMTATRALTSRLTGHTLSGVVPMLADNLHVLKLDGTGDIIFVMWTDSRQVWTDSLPPDTLSVRLASRPSAMADYLGNSLPLPALQGGTYPVQVSDRVVYATFPKAAVSPHVVGQAAPRTAPRTTVYDTLGRRSVGGAGKGLRVLIVTQRGTRGETTTRTLLTVR